MYLPPPPPLCDATAVINGKNRMLRAWSSLKLKHRDTSCTLTCTLPGLACMEREKTQRNGVSKVDGKMKIVQVNYNILFLNRIAKIFGVYNEPLS